MDSKTRKRIQAEKELCAMVIGNNEKKANDALRKMATFAHRGFASESPHRAAMVALEKGPYELRVSAAKLLRDAPYPPALSTLRAAAYRWKGKNILGAILEQAVYETEQAQS